MRTSSYVQDGKFYSSGGLTAGMDLSLSLVDADLGSGVALAVARDLVMYIRRPGNQAQYSAPLDAQVRGAGRFAQLVEWMLERLAPGPGRRASRGAVNMSPRNFQRVFRQKFSMTPARYVERLRLERACILLSTGNAIRHIDRGRVRLQRRGRVPARIPLYLRHIAARVPAAILCLRGIPRRWPDSSDS